MNFGLIFAKDERLYDSLIFAAAFAMVWLPALAWFRPEVVMAYGGAASAILLAMGGAKACRDWKDNRDDADAK